MKLRIFNAKLLLIGSLSLAAQGSFAQDEKPEKVQKAEKAAKADKQDKEEEKAFQQKMQKLQGQMRDLQREISKLQTEKFRERSEEFRKLSKELSERTLAQVDGQVNAAFNSLSFSPRSLKGLGAITTTLSNSNTLNFKYDDKKLQEQIQSGEVKEKIKNYSKSYSVDANDKLQINNNFGKVTVNTWAKNEVKVDIQIKAMANEDEDAQKLLDAISIADSKESSLVSFKTVIDNNGDNRKMGNWFSSGKSQVRKMEVNYTVYMPAKNQLDITNRFGAVVLPDLSGKLTLNLQYGTLTSHDLSNTENNIKVSFGDAKIASINGGELNVSYGKMILGTADRLKAKVSFGSLNIDRLRSSGNLTARYGDGVTVNELDKNLKNLNVDAQFTKVNLNVKDNYDFDVTTHFGSFDYGNTVKVTSRTPAETDRHVSFTRTFKGQVNKGDADKVITIKSSYASVKIDQ